MKVAVALVSTLGFLGCSREPPNLASPGSTIVCLGNSITAGVGAGGSPPYPQVVASELGVEVINAGVPGDTTADGLARIGEVLAFDPWLVVVELGGNDALRRWPIARSEANLRAIIEALLVAGVVPVLVEFDAPLIGGPYAELFERLSDDYGVPVIEDVLGSILGQRKLKSDQIHPNGEGHRRLGEAVAEELAPVLAARQRLLGSAR